MWEKKKKTIWTRTKRNCPNSTKLASVGSHTKQIWRKHGSTLTGMRVNRQQMSEHLRLGEIKIKPEQSERKIKELVRLYTIFNAQLNNATITNYYNII